MNVKYINGYWFIALWFIRKKFVKFARTYLNQRVGPRQFVLIESVNCLQEENSKKDIITISKPTELGPRKHLEDLRSNEEMRSKYGSRNIKNQDLVRLVDLKITGAWISTIGTQGKRNSALEGWVQ